MPSHPTQPHPQPEHRKWCDMCWEDLRDEEEYQLFRLPDGGTAELCKRCSTQVDYDTEATK